MKKLLAILLAASMLLVLAACDGGSSLPPPDTDGETGGDNAGNDTTANQGGTNTPDVPDVYTPDIEALYGGAIGIGVESGSAYFDTIKVQSRQSNRMTLIDDKLEEALPTFTNYVSVGGSWDKDAADITQVVDPTGEYDEETAEEEKNHVISVSSDGTGVFAALGETIWNHYQYTVKVLPADENSVINIYFCVKDEQNYFVLSLCEAGNTKADCYQVVNGEKKTAAFKVSSSLSLEAFTPVGITVNREIIDIYIDGSLKLSLFNPEFENQYYDYTGEIIPSSIADAGYGAPGEGLTYFQVAPENVIHDGKGTWGSNLNNIATMVFDMNISTYYDCDEKLEYADVTEDAECGIPGDGTFATAYVGAYFENGIKLTHIRYAPRADQVARMPGTVFQVSEDGVTWIDVFTVDTAPAAGDFATAKVGDGSTAYKYVRMVGASGCYGNVAEIELWGKAE